MPHIKGVHALYYWQDRNRDIQNLSRSDGTINVQLIAEKLGGGGHLVALLSLDGSNITEVKQL